MKNEKENKVISLPVVRFVDGKPVVTSLEIARRFDKRPDDVLKAIRNLECSEEFNLRNFAEIEKGYQDTRGRWQKWYLITRDLECSQEFNRLNFQPIEEGYQDDRGRWRSQEFNRG